MKSHVKKSHSLILSKLKESGLVNDDNIIPEEVINIIHDINAKTNLEKIKKANSPGMPTVKVTSIVPADEKNSVVESKKELHFLTLLRVTTKRNKKSISYIGNEISSYLEDKDHYNLTRTTRDFRNSFIPAHQYKIEYAIKSYNAMPIVEWKFMGDIYADVGHLTKENFYIECFRRYLKSTISTPLLTALGTLGAFIFVPVLAGMAPIQWCFCPEEGEHLNSTIPTLCVDSCYFMLCGPFIKTNIQTISCMVSYTNGFYKDQCNNGLRPLDKSKHIEIPLPSIARNSKPKSVMNSPVMSRDEKGFRRR